MLSLILSSCSGGESLNNNDNDTAKDNSTINLNDSNFGANSNNENTEVVSSSCSYDSVPVSNVNFASGNKLSSSIAKSAGFTKGISVFGINILATTGVSEDKLIHAANVMAELIDNDENGEVDNSCVLKKISEKLLFQCTM